MDPIGFEVSLRITHRRRIL